MRINAKAFLEQRLAHICAWCGRVIGQHEAVQNLGVSSGPNVDVTGLRGTFIPFPLLTGKIVPAMVSTEGSEAKRDGWHFIFTTCSQGCATELEAALEQEKGWFEAAAMLA